MPKSATLGYPHPLIVPVLYLSMISYCYLKVSGHAEVRHLGDPVLSHQHITSCQVSVETPPVAWPLQAFLFPKVS
jgi:hypothetical protein